MTITGPDARTGAPGQAVVDAALLLLERMGLTPRRPAGRPGGQADRTDPRRVHPGPVSPGQRWLPQGIRLVLEPGHRAVGQPPHRRAHAIGDPPARPAHPGQRRAPAELTRRAQRRRAPHRCPALHVQARRGRQPDQPGRQPRPESGQAPPPPLNAAGRRPGATADLGPGGPPAARTTGPAGGDRSTAVFSGTRTVRSWPLLILAAPAAAGVWSGWVGIAQKTGFGLVSPLPGILPSLHLDTSITLPVGVEAYAAYALRAWLARRALDQRPDPPVRQVVRDLLLRARHGRTGGLPPPRPGRDGAGTVARHHDRVLPAGPGPGHGDHAGPYAARRCRRRSGRTGQRDRRTSSITVPSMVRRGPGRGGPGPGRTPGAPGRVRSFRRDHDARAAASSPAGIGQARVAADRLAAAGRPVSRRALRSEGIRGSNQAPNALARTINAELAGTAVLPARPGNAVVRA